MKKTAIILCLLLTAFSAAAQDLRISQVDANSLLFSGELGIYFSVPGAGKDGLSMEDFDVIEETAGSLEITDFKQRPFENTPIDFILLIDNSGSMYDEQAGGVPRIERALQALGIFLDQIEASGDRAAVFTFNTEFTGIAPLGTSIADIRRRLSNISRPAKEMAYTELYTSLNSAASLFPKTSGRRSVIVLSDGENFPAGGAQTETEADDIVLKYHENGVSLDGISIADEKDRLLAEICGKSGGHFYDVRSTEQIATVYSDIREKIRSEFLLTVRMPPLKTGTGLISLEWNGRSDERRLIVPMLFGGSTGGSTAAALVILLAAAAALAAMFIIPFDKPAAAALIQSLESNQKTILSTDATVIGASRDADFTLAGSPGVDPEHAEILRDDSTGTYTLVSRKPVRVNNRKVKKKKLEPGDVIRIEGSTIIFDDPRTGGRG